MRLFAVLIGACLARGFPWGSLVSLAISKERHYSFPLGDAMKSQILGSIAFLLVVPSAVAQSSECKTAPLTAYINLAYESGCSIGGVVVFGFTEWIIPAGSKPILSENILVTPSKEDSRPRLEFKVNVKTAAGEFLDTQILFGVRGAAGQSPPGGIGGRITGASAGGDGAVTVIDTVCPGTRDFFEECLIIFWDTSTQRPFVSFVAGREAARSGEVRVSTDDALAVSVDIGVDGGIAGNAALQSVVVLLGAGAADQQNVNGTSSQDRSPDKSQLAFRRQ
jgi:hypothetical protein